MISSSRSASPSLGRLCLIGARQLAREWRSGDLLVLALAMIVAVGSTAAVRLFADRLDQAMTLHAAELLAADVVVSSSYPVPEPVIALARTQSLDTAHTLSFRSVVKHGDRFQLVATKAVDAGYPLRGQLELNTEAFGRGDPATRAPSAEEAWIDGRLAGLLGLEIGDPIKLGKATFEVTRFIAHEPDRGGSVFSVAPRVMVSLQAVAKTGLIQPGSRARYRLLVAGERGAIEQFSEAVTAREEPGLRIQGVESARPEMRIGLERARQFLSLAAIVSLLLSGVAIGLSARQYALRHFDHAALMRCFGASERSIVTIFSAQIGIVAIIGGLGGILLGIAGQAAIAKLLEAYFVATLPSASWLPVLWALAFGMVTLAGFGLPALMDLRRIAPLRVLRRDLEPIHAAQIGRYGIAFASSAALILFAARDITVGAWVLGGTIATVLVLAGFGHVVLQLLVPLRRRVGSAWRFGLANLSRRRHASIVQIIAFGLGLMALLLLTFIRTDLLEQWRVSLPEQTPNYFLVNIQPHERERLEQMLEGAGVGADRTYPMVRGRLTHISGQPVRAEDYDNDRAQRLATREFNLSFSSHLPRGNTLAAGQWWQPGAAGETSLAAAAPSPPISVQVSPPVATPGARWSVERGLAELLGITVGSTMSFRIGAQTVVGKVSSLRDVKWESFDVNFFVLGEPRQLERLPATYITSFYLPEAELDLLLTINERFPTVTVIDIDALISKLRALMDQASRGIEAVFALSIAAGILVLLAAVQSTLDERRRESAIIRSLGGSSRDLHRALAAEFLSLGVVAGIVAATAASAIGYAVGRFVFEFDPTINVTMWIIAVPSSALMLYLAGWLGARRTVRTPPTVALREL